jgi:hypothetical protein
MAHVIDQHHRDIDDGTLGVLRELIVEHERLDVLGKFVLDYEMPEWTGPIAFEDMIEHQEQHQECVVLAFRGARKTTWLTITRCLFEIIMDPDIRILLVSEAAEQAKVFLRSIKSHIENNNKFRRAFGALDDGARLWTDSEITITTRSKHYGEPTIMTAGIGTTLPSRHFDLIICDDLVTKDNSQTPGQRRKVYDYFYETLYPTLESPDGRLYINGTRWHEEDLYAHFASADYRHATLVVPVLVEETDESIWEEKFPTKRLHRIRSGNLRAFELQYMCRSGVGQGDIFTEEHFRYYVDLPADVVKWQGADLAVRQTEQADFFAHCTIAVQRITKDPYLINYRKTRVPFPRQPKYIADRWRDQPDVLAVGIETNQYQEALRAQIRHSYPDVPVIGRWTHKDKIIRANQVAILLTDRPLWVKHGHTEFMRLMRGFPNVKGSKDVFDAFDIALSLGMRGKKRRRKRKVGLI